MIRTNTTGPVDSDPTDAGTMIINPTADNTMIRNNTPLSTMTSALGTMVINEEGGDDGTTKC